MQTGQIIGCDLTEVVITGLRVSTKIEWTILHDNARMNESVHYGGMRFSHPNIHSIYIPFSIIYPQLAVFSYNLPSACCLLI